MYIVFVFSALKFVHLGPAAVLCAHEHACVTVHMYIAVNIFNNVCMCVRACRIERERERDLTTAIGLFGVATFSFAP